VIVYNIPPRAVVDITPSTMARLSELPRIQGVKDATADLSRICEERMLINKEFSYLSGEDMTAVAYNSLGGQGCISVTANIAPELCTGMQDACKEGDYAFALKVHDRLAVLHNALFLESSPAGVKYAASLLGLCSEECRAPIMPLSLDTKAMIRAAIRHCQLSPKQ